VDDVEFAVGVEPPQSVKHFHFNERLMMKTVLVAVITIIISGSNRDAALREIYSVHTT